MNPPFVFLVQIEHQDCYHNDTVSSRLFDSFLTLSTGKLIVCKVFVGKSCQVNNEKR